MAALERTAEYANSDETARRIIDIAKSFDQESSITRVYTALSYNPKLSQEIREEAKRLHEEATSGKEEGTGVKAERTGKLEDRIAIADTLNSRDKSAFGKTSKEQQGGILDGVLSMASSSIRQQATGKPRNYWEYYKTITKTIDGKKSTIMVYPHKPRTDEEGRSGNYTALIFPRVLTQAEQERADKAYLDNIDKSWNEIAKAVDDAIYGESDENVKFSVVIKPDDKREVAIVKAEKEHGFKNFKEATQWAKENIVGEYENTEIGSVNISNQSIGKYLSKKAVGKSLNIDVHLSTLKVIPSVIENSVVGEIHEDKKGDVNIRDIVRLYGCVNIDGTLYRVKSTVKRYVNDNEKTKAYSYEVTKIELLEGERGDVINELPHSSSNSIPVANLVNNPQNDKGNEKKFSVSAPVEKKGNLVAIHNLNADKLNKSLDLGGMPMPSIAITKVDMEHKNFGDISLVFDKSTINPSDKRNVVWSGDAWTPMIPEIEKKLSAEVVNRLYDKINNLVPKDKRIDDLYLEDVNISDKLRSWDWDVIKAYAGNGVMKQAYLAEQGKSFKVPMKEKLYGYNNELLRKIVNVSREAEKEGIDIGESVVFFNDDNNPKYKEVVDKIQELKLQYEIDKALSEMPDLSEDKKKKFEEDARKYHKPLNFQNYARLVDTAERMNRDLRGNNDKIPQVPDMQAAKKSIDKKVPSDNKKYNEWLKAQFEGIVEKEGIRNDKDLYTPSGNRRSFEQLHDDVNIGNILAYMLKQNERGGKGFFGSDIFGASSKKYQSMSEIRADADRLKNVDKDEYVKMKGDITNKLGKIVEESVGNEGFGAMLDMRQDIVEALSQTHDVNGLYNKLHRLYSKFTKDHAKRLVDIVKEIQQLPEEYFEAKPRRIVGFNEVKVAVVPKGTKKELKDKMKAAGIKNIKTYDPAIEGNRAEVLNKATEKEDIRFSINVEETNRKFNEDLQKQIDGTLSKGYIYQIGNPSAILRSAGIPDLPIELASNRLSDKSLQENHPFDLEEVKDLPKAIHNPLAVFRSATHLNSNVILTELKHKGKNFVVALRTNIQRGKIEIREINDIRSIHYKDSNRSILNWIVNDLADYIAPNFYEDWFVPAKNKLLSKQQSNSAEVRRELDLTAKIIQNFENPSINEEKFSLAEATENLEKANSKQEKAYNSKPIIEDDEVRYSLSRNTKQTIDAWLNKDDKHTEKEKESFKVWLNNKYADNKANEQQAIAKWWINGMIRINEDEAGIEEGLRLAKNMNVDAGTYTTPVAIIKDYFERHEEKVDNENLLSPDEFSNVLTNKQDLGNGLVVYDVEDSDKGQDAVRELMNSHLGKGFNCWCLEYADSEGKLTEQARYYWKRYPAIQKRVAFKDGKICSFCASNTEQVQWWDLSDRSHYENIPYESEIPNDELGRTAQMEYNKETEEIENVGDYHKGNKKNGDYWEWYNENPNALKLHEKYKGGKRDGLCEKWYEDGQKETSGIWKQGKQDGVHENWFPTGLLEYRSEWKNGVEDGLHVFRTGDGRLIIFNYKDGKIHGLSVDYIDGTGQVDKILNFENGERVDLPSEEEIVKIEAEYHRIAIEVGAEGERFSLAEEEQVRYSVVRDQKLIDKLDSEELVTVYRAMIVDKDGNLNYPMSSKGLGNVGKKTIKTEHPEWEQWEQAEENQDLVMFKEGDEYGHIVIKDDAGGSTPVAYNPYFHTSLQMLNDQFAKAWRRPNMVTVECLIPKSEITEKYKSPMAKNSTGETVWTNGVVSRTLKVKPRRVILSRYCKPMRIVGLDEYAQSVKKLLEDNNVLENGIPFSNVTPAQRDALAKAGVKITEPTGNGKNAESMAAYEEWKNERFSLAEATEKEDVRFSVVGNIEEAKSYIENILEKAEGMLLPKSYESINEFKQDFIEPVETPIKLITVGEGVIKKIYKNNRVSISGALKPTLKNPDFILRDVDGSDLYIKVFKEDNNKKYNIAVINKQNELEDYISSIHKKTNNNILNKIEKGASLLRPIKASYGNESQSNETPSLDGKDTTNSQTEKKNGEKFSLAEEFNKEYEEAGKAEAEEDRKLAESSKVVVDNLISNAGIESEVLSGEELMKQTQLWKVC